MHSSLSDITPSEEEEATSATEEDPEPQVEEEAAAVVLLGTKQEQEAIESGSSFGYSTILGLSAVATVAYLYKRRQDEKSNQTASDSLDEGYQLV